MPGLQDFLVRTIPTAAADLLEAIGRLPEDKRGWAPASTSRSALDQLAEVAIINGGIASTIANRGWSGEFSMDGYVAEKAALSADYAALKDTLDKNTTALVEAIGAVPDGDLGIEVATPFGPIVLDRLIAMPYWNMSYHEGQINYIASILDCLS